MVRNHVTRIGWSAARFILRETSPIYEPHYFTRELTKRRSVNQRVGLKGMDYGRGRVGLLVPRVIQGEPEVSLTRDSGELPRLRAA
jgi:hypothetical protein